MNFPAHQPISSVAASSSTANMPGAVVNPRTQCTARFRPSRRRTRAGRAALEKRTHGGRTHEPVIRAQGQTARHAQHDGALDERRERHGGEHARNPDRPRQVDEANLANIPVTYMAGSADRMRIHHTAVWRVRHKRAFVHARPSPHQNHPPSDRGRAPTPPARRAWRSCPTGTCVWSDRSGAFARTAPPTWGYLESAWG